MPSSTISRGVTWLGGAYCLIVMGLAALTGMNAMSLGHVQPTHAEAPLDTGYEIQTFPLRVIFSKNRLCSVYLPLARHQLPQV